MPQLDIVTFISQIFWLLLIFFSLYLLFLKYVLPTILASLRFRTKKLAALTKEIGNLGETGSQFNVNYESMVIKLADAFSKFNEKTNKKVETFGEDLVGLELFVKHFGNSNVSVEKQKNIVLADQFVRSEILLKVKN